ncbi:calcium-binding protein 39-like isoform X2 [Ptychodera flava]|uniref:calcium-binding protein 39-like isoform X2 n=1 Tax=Ptychodera flava TaxID=63121 RepID=UPI00396A3DE1
MPLFGSAIKSPQELAKVLRDALVVLQNGNTGDKKVEKASEDVSKILAEMMNILYGTGDQEPQPELVAQLVQEFYNLDILLNLVNNLQKIGFEAKKDVAQIFKKVLRRQIGTRSPTVEYITAKKEILFILLKGYENQEIALNCGVILRECVLYEPLAKILLQSEEFYNLFKYVEMSTFDLASDAFATFKLLSELLLGRHNLAVMTKYIGNPDNLKLMMDFLRDKSRNIQFEAFHVFKVFVANPNKTQPILDILLKNKEKLVEFLGDFHNDRTDDEQFNDEKTYLIKQISELSPTA